MGRIYVIIPDDLEKKFREKAERIYGRRGIGRAVAEALTFWINSETPSEGSAIYVICPECGYGWYHTVKVKKQMLRVTCPVCGRGFSVKTVEREA